MGEDEEVIDVFVSFSFSVFFVKEVSKDEIFRKFYKKIDYFYLFYFFGRFSTF